MKRRIAVRGIFVHDGKLLCVKLKPYNGERKEDFWCTIGGGVNDGEPLLVAIRREIVEETGIVPTIGNLLFVQQYNEPQQECIEFFYAITNAKDYIDVDLTQSSHGMEEIAELAFIDPGQNHVLPLFLQEVDYTQIDTASPVKFFNYL